MINETEELKNAREELAAANELIKSILDSLVYKRVHKYDGLLAIMEDQINKYQESK